MKARNIFALLGLTFAMGAGVAAGVALAQPKEASATTTSVEIAGSFTDWATNKVAMTLDGDYYTYEREFELNDEFKVVVNNSDWVGANWEGVGLISGIVDGGGSDHNFKIATAGNYRVKAAKTIGDYEKKGYGVTLEKIVPAPDRMITVTIDLGDLVNIDGFNSPEACFFDANGETFEEYRMLHRLSSLSETLYTVNYTYHNSQALNCVKFLFKEGSEDKWSENVAFNPSNGNAYIFQYDGHWDQGSSPAKWDCSRDSNFGEPKVRGGGGSDTDFDVDYATGTYSMTYVVNDASTSVQIFLGWWGYGGLRASCASAYTTTFTLNSFKVKEAGTYDIFGYNEYSDGGVFELKKRGTEVSYIYYVTASNTPTNDYIYSWGGSKQFGNDFPGTKVTSCASVAEVTGNGILHFQGGDDAVLVYKIPVIIGYPDAGDLQFIFSNGTDAYKTADRYFVPHAAYWWTGDANTDAGAALAFLKQAEDIRNGATNFSVCQVSKENATTVVNAYNALSSTIRTTYVDCTKVYTYTTEEAGEHAPQGLVLYKDVLEQLAKIAGIALEGSERTVSSPIEMTGATDSTALIAVVSIIALVSVSSVAVLLVIKKRKHN